MSEDKSNNKSKESKIDLGNTIPKPKNSLRPRNVDKEQK
jgi:hypothetical protein